MISIFCSKKLSKLLDISGNQLDTSETSENWNGHFFYFNKRKCILFINKETLYSFVLLDVLKKDVKNINDLFVNNFIQQLYSDRILSKDKEDIIRKQYKKLTFRLTDNDRKVIGAMNDCIYRIKYYATPNSDAFENVKEYIRLYLNEVPFSALKFRRPKEFMKDKISTFT